MANTIHSNLTNAKNAKNDEFITEMKKNILAELVKMSVSNLDARDIEEYEEGLYNIVDLPQSPNCLEEYKAMAISNGLDVEAIPNEYVKISYDDDNWIRFNLYQEDEPYYGDKGDINSLDITREVYKALMNDDKEQVFADKESLFEIFIDKNCFNTDIDEAIGKMKENNCIIKFVDEKISEGLEEEGCYLMMRSYDISIDGVSAYVRFYYGNDNYIITDYDIEF